jgi:hypothetical protein
VGFRDYHRDSLLVLEISRLPCNKLGIPNLLHHISFRFQDLDPHEILQRGYDLVLVAEMCMKIIGPNSWVLRGA